MSVELVGPANENLGSSVSRMPPVNNIISSCKMDWTVVIYRKLLLLKSRKTLSDASDEQHHIQMSKSPSSKLAQIGLHHLHRKAVPQFLQAFEIIIKINQ